jgi:hypothetical protein
LRGSETNRQTQEVESKEAWDSATKQAEEHKVVVEKKKAEVERLRNSDEGQQKRIVRIAATGDRSARQDEYTHVELCERELKELIAKNKELERTANRHNKAYSEGVQRKEDAEKTKVAATDFSQAFSGLVTHVGHINNEVDKLQTSTDQIEQASVTCSRLVGEAKQTVAICSNASILTATTSNDSDLDKVKFDTDHAYQSIEQISHQTDQLRGVVQEASTKQPEAINALMGNSTPYFGCNLHTPHRRHCICLFFVVSIGDGIARKAITSRGKEICGTRNY